MYRYDDALKYEQHYILFLYSYTDELPFGRHYVFKFNNWFGASIIHDGKDTWELAVIKFDESGEDYVLSYNTDITDDVVRHLTDEDVNKLLTRIQNLDKNGKETTEDETEQD